MKYLLVFFLGILLISCAKKSELKLQNELKCNTNITLCNLEKTTDYKDYFAIHLPKNWKVNLYFDNGLSSIYAADTTINLSKSTLIDAAVVYAPIAIDSTFKATITNDNSFFGLKELQTDELQFLNKKSYYSLAKGVKGKFSYHILNVFTPLNSEKFLRIKTEIYGDTLVNERLCFAVALLNKLELLEFNE